MTAALLVFFMVSPAAPEHWSALYSVYGRCAIIAMLALYFWKCGLRGTVEVKLVIWYAIWLFVTRLLNTDYYLENEFDLVLKSFLCAAVLSTGLVLDSAQRRHFFDIVIAIVGGFYFIVAVLAITACFLGIYFYIPPENIPFGIESYYMYASFTSLLRSELTAPSPLSGSILHPASWYMSFSTAAESSGASPSFSRGWFSISPSRSHSAAA